MLTQHGIDDTIVDVIFDVLGAIVVGTRGTVHPAEVADCLVALLEERLEV